MVQDNEYRKCPFCAELIKKKAIKCKHCKTLLEAEPAVKTPAKIETPGKEKTTCHECGKKVYVGASKCRYCKASIVTGDQQEEKTPQMIDKTFIDLRKQKLHRATNGLLSKIGKTSFYNSTQKIISTLTVLFSEINKTSFYNIKQKVTITFTGLFSRIEKDSIKNSKQKIVSAITWLFSKIDRTFFDNSKHKLSVAASGLFSKIEKASAEKLKQKLASFFNRLFSNNYKFFIENSKKKLVTTLNRLRPKIDKSFFDNSKEKIASAFTGLFSRIDKTFLEKNKRIITLSAIGLFALILITFTSVQLINRFSDRVADSGLSTDSSLAADLNGELDEDEEEIIESPLVIIFANRTVAFEDKKPPNPEEVILVLMFSGVTDATVENSHLMHNGEKYPFFSGYRGSMGEVLTFMYAAFVPKDVLEFELYVADYPPETVFADEEIQEEL